MRKLRVVFTTVGGAMPALLAVMLTPAVDACGGGAAFESVDTSGEDASRGDAPISSFEAGPPPSPPPTDPGCPSYIVDIPPAGTPAEPGLLCAVPSPVASNVSARVTLSAYSEADLSAIGEITVPPDIEEAIVGLPTVTVRDASHAELSAMVVTEMTKATNRFRFKVTWPERFPHLAYGVNGTRMTVQTTFEIACADGGTTTVEAFTRIDLCSLDYGKHHWVSSGDACSQCEIIAEMAPSPIVSDKRGDDLPLGMVIRLRVVEVARAGRQILLFADNDAGPNAKYEWRVSEGSIEHVADDVVLWTLPEDSLASGASTPFGQVAVWNDDGAAVENFVFSLTWKAAA